MRIGILETGVIPSPLDDRHGTISEMFVDLLGTVDDRLRFQSYAAVDGMLPAADKECDAYLVTGSRHGVYDRLPWMAELADFARRARADGAKLVGICFGHQFLADAFGGEAGVAAQGWGVGHQRYNVYTQQTWMTPAQESFCSFVHHQDQVRVPPPGAVVLAGNDFCPNGMLQLGDEVLMLQSHPEMTPAFGADLLRLGAADLDDQARAAAFASLDRADDAGLVARWIVNFLIT